MVARNRTRARKAPSTVSPTLHTQALKDLVIAAMVAATDLKLAGESLAFANLTHAAGMAAMHAEKLQTAADLALEALSTAEGAA